VSPDPATPYRVRLHAPLEDQRIALVARAADDAAMLYWYEDGRLLASAAPGAPAHVRPRTGAHRLVVVDDRGRTDEVVYRVESGPAGILRGP
jgi:penicillin-binding protein 1C